MALSYRVRNDITGIDVLAVDGDTPPGAGVLSVTGASALTWQAPGSETAGSAVTIADGEHKVCYDGDDATLFILVERTTADDLDTSQAAVVIITTGVTTAERIVQVDEAITRCLAAQMTTFGGDQVMMAQLDALRDYRRALARQLAEEDGTGGRVGTPDFRGHF